MDPEPKNIYYAKKTMIVGGKIEKLSCRGTGGKRKKENFIKKGIKRNKNDTFVYKI